MKLPHILQALEEVPDALPAQPEGLHAGLAIALATEEAAKPCKAANHVANARWGFRHRPHRQNVRCLPLLGREQQGRILVRMDPSQPHHPLQTLGHHHIDRQGQLNLSNGRQLQGFDSAAVLQHIEAHLNFPACPIPVDQLRRGFRTAGRPIGQQPPFDRLDALGGIHFARHQASHPQRFAFCGGQGQPMGSELLVNFPCRLSIIEAKRGASANGISRVRWKRGSFRGSSGSYGAAGGSAVMLDGLCEIKASTEVALSLPC
jgi:hypothetical protein